MPAGFNKHNKRVAMRALSDKIARGRATKLTPGEAMRARGKKRIAR